MKSTLIVCLLAFAPTRAIVAQESSTPTLRPGVTVQLPVARHAVEMDVADKVEATIVTVTQNGGIFVGIKRVELSSLGGLSSDTIYVKADARVSYQEILTVLEALEGHTRVLLTALPTNSKTTGVLPPYGVKVILNNH